MKVRVIDPRDLRVGDKVGPFRVISVDPKPTTSHVFFYGLSWQDDAVVAELLKMHEVWHDDPEPDVPGERIVARGRVHVGEFFWIDSSSPFNFLRKHAKSGDEIIVVRGETE